jgi:hypothetical protein
VKRKTAICFAVAALSLGAFSPTPAAGQAGLPPYEIMTIIRSTGLDPVGRPVRRGSTYLLRAIDGYGQEVTVTVDAHRGRIVSVRPVVPVAAPYGPPGTAYVPPPYDVEPPYVAPPPYYPGDEFESDATYEPMSPDVDGPRVIYAPREFTGVPRPPARIPSAAKKAPANKSTSSSKAAPAPKAAATPAETVPLEQPTGTITGAAPSAEASSALAVPPVQTLE